VLEAGCDASVVACAVMDIVDLAALPTAEFDAAVCYGGALSYVFDRADRAVGELLRVTKPGGLVLLSVMSLLGTSRRFLADGLAAARAHGPGVVDAVLATGDQVGTLAGGHACHLYRWAELEALLRRHPCEVVDAAAANFLAIGGNEALLPPVLDDPALWAANLAWEVASCRQPGAIDGGTHIIAVVRRA
jgi:SAM-dependent methyltransferase